jgi:hypothetical protein
MLRRSQRAAGLLQAGTATAAGAGSVGLHAEGGEFTVGSAQDVLRMCI